MMSYPYHRHSHQGHLQPGHHQQGHQHHGHHQQGHNQQGHHQMGHHHHPQHHRRSHPPYAQGRHGATAAKKLVLAKALYDNVGESKDELTFYRGDVMTVLEEEPNGLTGWWLCLLQGRRGIAPGNRLQIMSHANKDLKDPSAGGGSTNGGTAEETVYRTPPSQAGVNWHRRSWHMHPDKSEQPALRGTTFKPLVWNLKVVTPQKLGGVYIYDQPNQGYQDYDVPPSRYFPAQNGTGRLSADGAPGSVYDTPTSARSRGQQPHMPHPNDVYDVPPSAHAHIPIGSLSPSNRSSTASVLSTGSTATVSSSGTSSGPGSGGLGCGLGSSNPPSMCGSARSSTEVQDIYDVPPPAKAVVVVPKSPLAVLPSGQQLSTSAGGSGPQEVYDTPRAPTPAGVAKILIEDYDCPPKRTTTPRDVDSGIDASKEEGAYDVPQNYNKQQEHDIDNIYDHPTNNAPAWQQGRVQGLSVAGGAQDGSIYDIPPQVTRDSAISMRSDCSSLMDEVSSRLSSCSVASSGGSSDAPHVPYDELPLDLDAAMELLVKLQQEVHSATSRLLSFVHSAWRQQEQLEPKLYNVKLGCLGVQATLQEFVDFGQGALANSAKADDKKLVKKLHQLLEPLQESLKTVNKGMRHLNELNWSISELVRNSEPQGEQQDDALGAIVGQAKEVPGTVRILASCIQGNSTLLFKRAQHVEGTSSASSSPKKGPPTRPKPPPVMPKPKPGSVREPSLERRTSVQDRPLPAPPVRSDQLSPGVSGSGDDSSAVYEVPHGDEAGDLEGDKDKNYNSKEDFLEDYDYVHLENRPAPAADSTAPTQTQPTSSQRADGAATEDETDSGIVANDSSSGLTPKFQERLQQLQGDNNNISKPGGGGGSGSSGTSSKPHLHANDRQLLSFYAGQVGTHTAQLVNVIDSFFQCIEYNQPPKVFIAHSKSVVMAAHRMVYICDTIHRNLLNEEVRVKVMACANYLCDCLKLTVNATKSAALQYPSVVTVQEMVDRVVDVSHAANEIKLVITQAASIL